jgi:DNA-binding MarR family transcriptional regulator
MNRKPRTDPRIATIRSFNRFYTRQIGVLNESYLDSPYSLTEGRVLYELAHRKRPTATAVCAALDLDPGYLSRILRTFRRERLIRRERSESDGRETCFHSLRVGERRLHHSTRVQIGKWPHACKAFPNPAKDAWSRPCTR